MAEVKKPKKIRTTRRSHTSYLKAHKSGNYFGETLKEFRKQRKLTQKDAADFFAISQPQWSGYEKGTSRPTLDTILSMAEKFEVDPFVLIGKILDKFKFPNNPDRELSFLDYDKISKKYIETYRDKKLVLAKQEKRNKK